MKKVIGLALISLFVTGSVAAASGPRHHRIPKGCRCDTSQPSCKGTATFAGTPQTCAISGNPMSCDITSSTGGSQFTLYNPGDVFQKNVQYGDKVACVLEESGVPPGA